jgi:hypothetical protein
MRSSAIRLTVPVAALVTVLAVAAPAWAGTAQIQDDAHVLNATAVQNDAATLPVGIYIWTTTQDAASKSTFDTDVRNKVSSQAGISQNAALAAESNANRAFVATMQSSRDYTSAVTAALDNLRTTLQAAHRGRAPAPRVVTHSVGIGLLPIILLLGAIVAVVVLLRRRIRAGFGRLRTGPMTGGPPPMGSYPNYGSPYDEYGRPYRSGMGPGAAGAIGAVGGGLLGYELGKMQGEEQQFRHDEMMYDRDRGQYDSADQGDWVVGQDSDFGGDAGGNFGGGSNDSGGGDW